MQKKTKKIIISTILFLLTISIIILLTKSTNKPMPQNITEQAKANYTTEIGTQTYDITNAVLEPEGITPTISAGMIPVKWNGENFEIITRQDKTWYDYTKGQPAYIMLNDGYYKSELEVGIKEDQLMENNEGTNITHPEDLGTICMWIPRFAYNEQGKILYIKQSHSVAGTYTMPEIFTYQAEKRDLSLAGIWVECKPLANTSEVNTKINKMNGKNNTYGFLANTIATNANNETSYKTTIETYNQYIANVVGATSVRNTQENLPNVALTTEEYPSNIGNNASTLPQITDISNTNRTILKIINTNQLEPIKGKAYYDETEEKIKIEITYRTNAITQILNKKGEELSSNSTTADSGDEIIGNGIYKYIAIDNKGNIKEITTKVEGLKIYVIPDLETLKQFRDDVNEGNTYAGITVIQTADIAMNEGKYTIDEQTGDVIFDEEKEPEQWTPIGDYKGKKRATFAGIYNGQGYTISGIYINGTQYQGLFGAMTDGRIQNLGIKESYVQGNSVVGGILGTASISNKIITIENCYNEGTIIGTYIGSNTCVGGICGAGRVNLINCYNTGNISGNMSVGGIIGSNSYGVIENCYNTGTISIFDENSPYGIANLGGIIGDCSSYDGIKNCYNTGDVIGLKNSTNIGGIKGSGHGDVENCYNNGNISGIAYLGGICGNESEDIKNCYNTGSVSGTGSLVGGISGNTWKIESCYNVGLVSGKSDVGGITGLCSKIISNTYYLEGTATYGFGSGKSNTNAEPKTEAEIKELTTVLNGEVEPENAIWVEDTLCINNGYPILAWQLETIE